MQCLNLKNKEVKAAFDEVAKVLNSEDAAYYVISENNGYAIDQDPDGSQSQLFQDLLQKYNGDRDKAIIERAKSFDYLSADIQTRNLSFEEQFLSSTDENARFIEVSIDNLNKYNFNTKKELDDRLRSIRKNLEQGLISRLNSIDEKDPAKRTELKEQIKYQIKNIQNGVIEDIKVIMDFTDELKDDIRTVAREVIDAGGGYIAAPSANTSGRPSPTTAQHVAEDLTGRVDMIVDGGAVEIGVESTILDVTVEPPMILRPGAITKEMFEEVIGEVTVDRTLIRPDSKQVPKAPGMKYRHYAPKADLTIIEGPLEKVVKEINKRAKEKSEAGYKVGVIGTEETVADYKSGDVKCIGTRADESTIAANLFRILREFDDDQVDYIYSESFDTAGIGSAIMNRLLKAAGHHIEKLV